MSAGYFCAAVVDTPRLVILLSLLISSGAAVEPELLQISPNAAAPPPESAEARIKLRQHREASALNRFTFPGNVLKGTGDVVEHWIVMFCSGWHEKCQSLMPSYELLGVQWEDKLNTALMSSKVRFAKVDCATEKALCVSLGIDDYPSVVHYHHQQRANAWFGGAPGLVRFIKDALQPPRRRPVHKGKLQPSGQQGTMEQALGKAIDLAVAKPVKEGQATTCASDGKDAKIGTQSSWFWRLLRPLCFLVTLSALSRYVWTLIASLRSRSCATDKEIQAVAVAQAGRLAPSEIVL
jgi:hypothetical protein